MYRVSHHLFLGLRFAEFNFGVTPYLYCPASHLLLSIPIGPGSIGQTVERSGNASQRADGTPCNTSGLEGECLPHAAEAPPLDGAAPSVVPPLHLVLD